MGLILNWRPGYTLPNFFILTSTIIPRAVGFIKSKCPVTIDFGISRFKQTYFRLRTVPFLPEKTTQCRATLIKHSKAPRYTGVTLSLLSLFVLACMFVVWEKYLSRHSPHERIPVFCLGRRFTRPAPTGSSRRILSRIELLR